VNHRQRPLVLHNYILVLCQNDVRLHFDYFTLINHENFGLSLPSSNRFHSFFVCGFSDHSVGTTYRVGMSEMVSSEVTRPLGKRLFPWELQLTLPYWAGLD